MKIKTTKQMRLDELIRYVWENDIESTLITESSGHSADADIYVARNGEIQIINDIHRKTDTYDFLIEEELTEETEFDELWEVYYNKGRDDVDAYTNGKVSGVTSTSISQILKENSIDYENVTLAIFRKDTLIWTKDTGIPTEGVIET